jgi:hypothetical protein
MTQKETRMKARKQPVETTLLFGGDFCPIGRYEKMILAHERIFDETVSDLLMQSDVTLVNLEAPLCRAGLPTDSLGGSGLRADPRIAAYMRRCGIDVAGLANNHIRDFKDEGVRQTLRNLDKSGLLATGAGLTLADAEEPLAVEVNGMRVGIWALAEKELNVASESSAGSSWFRPEEDANRVRELRAGFDFLVVYLHAGHEFTHTPSPRMRTACRALVDAGADAVIAHHPHVIQGIERYKGSLIAYSLGNLVFDSPYVSAYKDTDAGFLVRLTVSPHAIEEAELIPYRLGADGVVTLLGAADRKTFDRRMRDLSRNITEEARFGRAWEENVRFRWETEYRRILATLSERFHDPANKDFARRTGNLFASPTHVEMLMKSFSMLEQGKLSRTAS